MCVGIFGSLSCVPSNKELEKQSKINKMNFVNKEKKTWHQNDSNHRQENLRACQICWYSLIEPCSRINESTISILA